MGDNLFIGSQPEATHRSPLGWIWLKPIDNALEVYELGEGGWTLQATISLTSHEHATHGNINFTGTISAGGEAGLSGTKVLDGKQLTFTNGILTGYEVV